MDATQVSEPSAPALGASSRLVIGTRLGDRYEIRGLLGEGGMGTVYRAFDAAVGEQVALKVVRSTIDGGALRDEVRLAQKVTHVNVCRIYDLEEVGGLRLVKMEYVDGTTLANRLAAGAVPIDDAVSIARAIARGLGAAHAVGIVHRDLKPGNVMLAGPRVVLVDFGIAATIDDRDDDRAVGTPGYMAPEQLAGGVVDDRSDLYALGCVLYEMLAGEAVFAGTTIELAARHASVPAPDVRAKRPDAPRWLARATGLLLGKSPALRSRGLAMLFHGPRGWRRPAAAVLAGIILITLVSLLAWGRVTVSDQQADIEAMATIDRARHLLDSDPAAAIATVRDLVHTKYWLYVRAIAEGAQAEGVPWVIRHDKRLVDPSLDPAGHHLVANTDAGVVWVYDLDARTGRAVSPPGASNARYTFDGSLAITRDRAIELAGGPDIVIDHRIDHLELDPTGPRGYALDREGHIWRLELDTRRATDLGDLLPRPGARWTYLELSPDGRWLALHSEQGMVLVATAAPATPAALLVDDVVSGVRWSHDSTRCVVTATKRGATVVDVSGGSPAITDTVDVAYPGPAFFDSDDQLVYANGETTFRLAGKHANDYWREPAIFIAETRDALVLSSKVDDEILLRFPAGGQRTLHTDAAAAVVVASRRSPFIVAATEHELYLWRVDAVVPHMIETHRPSHGGFVGDTLFLLDGDVINSYDGTTFQKTTLGHVMPSLEFGEAAAAKTRLIAYEPISHAGYLAGRGTLEPLPKLEQGVMLDDDHAVTLAGSTVTLLDLPAHRATKLFAGPAPWIDVAHEGTWIVVRFTDGTLWRRDTATGVEAVAKPDPGNHLVLALAVDGTVGLAAGTDLQLWDPDGSLNRHVRLPSPITMLATEGRWFRVASHEAAYVIDSRDPERVQAPAFTSGDGLSTDLQIACDREGDRMWLRDLVTGVRWSILESPPAADGMFSPSSTRIYLPGIGRSAVWIRPTADSPEATARWLETMTNASIDPLSGAVVWQ